jgi:hypothetical protein
MADDLPALIARVEQLRDALISLGEGQRDQIEGLSALRSALIVLDTKGDLRAEQAEKIAEVVDELRRSLTAIEKPVVAHYDGIRIAQEAQSANVGKWANILSPDRIVAAVKYVLPIAAALAAGGFFGNNLKGCGGGFTAITAADVEAAHAAEPAPEATP